MIGNFRSIVHPPDPDSAGGFIALCFFNLRPFQRLASLKLGACIIKVTEAVRPNSNAEMQGDRPRRLGRSKQQPRYLLLHVRPQVMPFHGHPTNKQQLRIGYVTLLGRA